MGEGRGGWGVRERELRMADAPLAPTPTPAPPENPTWRSHARDSWSSRSWASGHRPDSNNNVMPKRGRNYPAIFCRSKKLSRHTAIYAPKLSRYFSPAKKLSRRTILRGRKLSRLSRPRAHVKTRCFSIILGPQATIWAAKHLRAAAPQHTISQCPPQWALPSGPWLVCCGRWV